MKITVLSLVILVTASMHADDLSTTSGKKYSGITITGVEPDALVIEAESGIERIPFTDLSEEIRTKYGYDPAKAAKFADSVRAAAAERAAVLARRKAAAAAKQTAAALEKQSEADQLAEENQEKAKQRRAEEHREFIKRMDQRAAVSAEILPLLKERDSIQRQMGHADPATRAKLQQQMNVILTLINLKQHQSP